MAELLKDPVKPPKLAVPLPLPLNVPVAEPLGGVLKKNTKSFASATLTHPGAAEKSGI